MMNFNVMVCELQHFVGYPPTDLLWISPILEAHVVGKYLDLVWASCQEGVLVSQCLDDGH